MAPQAPKIRRWYVRCADCLTIAAIEAPERPWEAVCGLCGGAIRLMGEVIGHRLGYRYSDAPCDGRCTAARGPTCDCKCLGANHGSGALVEFIAERGAVPVVRIPDTAKARRTAEEWRAALAGFLESFRASRYGAIWAAKGRDEWIADWSAYLWARDTLRVRNEARECNAHKARMDKVAAAVRMLAGPPRD